jgi:hypothetical protein
MSLLCVMPPHRRDESWPASLCKTLFALAVCAEIAAHSSSPIPSFPASTCGCKKLSLVPSVTMSACVLHNRVPKRHTSGQVSYWQTCSAQPPRSRQHKWPAAGVSGLETWSWRLTSRTLQGLSSSSWTCACRTSVSGVALAPLLISTCTALLLLA